MTSHPKQREKITRAELLTEIKCFLQQAKDLEKDLSEFTSGVDLLVSIQPSLTTAARNSRAVVNHLAAAQTLVEAQEEVRRG
jgi:hypothetical protein